MAGTKGEAYTKRLEDENRLLKQAVEELTILNDISRAISSAWSLDDIMELIVRKCIKHFEAEQGSVILLDAAQEEKDFRTMIRRADRSEKVLPYRLGMQLRGWMLKYQKPLLINDLKGDSRFKVVLEKDQPIRSVLSVPLLFKGRMVGLLNVFNKKTRGGFTEADKRLLAIIGTESAQVIESARLYEEAQALSLMQKEMKVAYEIQMGLLPQTAPEIEGYDIWGKSIPAKDIGGDYYDFVRMDDGRLGICLGDVSGKGMPAALLMANVYATLRGQILQGLGPRECLERANKHLLAGMDAGRFVTLFHATLDGKTDQVCYCNAGHNHPFLFKEGKEAVRLTVSGVALGCMESPSYTEGCVEMAPGDIMLLYSDGITEAVNKDVEMFGEQRLADVVTANRGDGAEQLVEKIIAAVRQYSGETSQMDDMTAVVMKREGGA
jgi:sigma-B regulation protein RsbU (phosphoserine phosphatase)